MDSQQPVDKNPEGRPTKYKPEYCEMLIEHMSKGFALESFGATLPDPVARDTVYEWMKVHPEFSDSAKIGRDKSLIFFEKLGIKGMHENKINASVYALTMANKHKWLSGRTDLTTDGQKIESPILYIPAEEA